MTPSPDTLPADFFDKPKQSASPDTLPPDFFQGRSAKPEEPWSVGGFLGNVAKSGASLAGNIATTGLGALEKPVRWAGQAITGHDIAPTPEEDQFDTMWQAPFGAIQKPVRKVAEAITGHTIPETPEEEKADAVGAFYKNRYGDIHKIAHTLYSDPVGAAMDVSAVAGGVSGALRGAGSVADAANLGRTAGMLRAGADAGGEIAKAANPVVQGVRAVKAAKSAIPPAIEAAQESFSPTDPHDAFFRAVKPRANRLNFSSAMETALPDIKAVENPGAPISDAGGALDAIKSAKHVNRAAYDRFRGPAGARGQMVDLSGAADAMEASIPHDIAFEASKGVPDAVAARDSILNQAKAYRTQVPMEVAEQQLKAANARLDDFYAKYPRQQWKALSTNPETAPLYARAEALRDALYSALDDPNQGAGAREIQRRYGNLLEVEQELQRRKNVSDRQQPQNLAQQLGKAQAAGQYAKGAFRLAHGDLTGAADIAGARAQRAMTDWMKEQQTTNALIQRSFKHLDGAQRPFPQPQPVNIRGLLGPASMPIGAPDIGSSFGDIIGQPQRNLNMRGLDALDEANLRGSPPEADSSAMPIGNQRQRRAASKPPETGIPEGVSRGQAMRDDLSMQLTGKPFRELSNRDRIAVDDHIARQNSSSNRAAYDPLGLQQYIDIEPNQ